MDKQAALAGCRSKRAYSFPSEGKHGEVSDSPSLSPPSPRHSTRPHRSTNLTRLQQKMRPKSPRKPHRPLAAFAAKVLPLTPIGDKRDRPSPTDTEGANSGTTLVHPPMLPYPDYGNLAISPLPKTISFDSTTSQASFATQTSEMLDPWDAQAYDARIGTDIDSWDNPQLHKILDTLQVAMMSRCHDANATLPQELNGLVSRLIEAFPVMNRKACVAKWRLDQVTAARERDLNKFKELSREWVSRERDFKAEIRRLEKLLVKESRKGVEAVSLARSRSVVNRSDTMRFVRSLDQIEEDTRTNIDDFESRAEKDVNGWNTATVAENPASYTLLFDEQTALQPLRIEPPRVAFDNNHDREITRKMEQARNGTGNREIILPNHPGRPRNKGMRLFPANLWQTYDQRKSERQKKIASLKRLDTSKRPRMQPSDSNISSQELAAGDTSQGEDNGVGGDSAQDSRAHVENYLKSHENEIQASRASGSGESKCNDTSNLEQRPLLVESVSSTIGDSDLDVGTQCGSTNMSVVPPERSDTVTQANYSARLQTDCSYPQNWQQPSHMLQTGYMAGQKRFSFEIGDDLIGLSPMLATNEYTSYPFPNMEGADDLNTPPTASDTTSSPAPDAVTLSHACGGIRMTTEGAGKVCADEACGFETQMALITRSEPFNLPPTSHSQHFAIRLEHAPGAKSSHCSKAAGSASSNKKRTRTTPHVEGAPESLTTTQGKPSINKVAVAAAVAASSRATLGSGNFVSGEQTKNTSYRHSTSRSDV